MRRLALAVGLALVAASLARAEPPASVAGEVSVALSGVRLADVSPAVVYLEPLDAPPPRPRTAPAELRQHDARFQPGFLVVSVGQPVAMPNDDTIFHNIFSYSRPNDFDLGLYRGGESRSVSFRHAGPVRIYCSIHDRMNGLIFVSPSPWFAVPSASGGYRIDAVPAGNYRVRVWSDRLPELVRPIALRSGEDARANLVLGQ
jgi:plastocyanin